jgi:hydrogenase maturation factor HypE
MHCVLIELYVYGIIEFILLASKGAHHRLSNLPPFLQGMYAERSGAEGQVLIDLALPVLPLEQYENE